MPLILATRASDSPWVATVWTGTSDSVSEMTSVAGATWGLVFWNQDGTAHVSVTGPGTTAGTAPVPEGAEFVGIEFAVGTSLRSLPASSLVNGGEKLPDVTRRTFPLDGWVWQSPGPDDAEALVERLVRSGTVVRDPLVAELRSGGRPSVSARTVERRFRAATGLTQGEVRQIERARTASSLLAAGMPTSSVVADLGYFDEPHLAQALRRFIGRTARQLRDGSGGALGLAMTQPSRPIA